MREVYFTAERLDRDASERYEDAETGAEARHWAYLSREAERRAQIAFAKLGGEPNTPETEPRPDPVIPKDSGKEPMTIEAIERDPWNAVDLDIPEDASRELLSLVAATAFDLRGVVREGYEDPGFDEASERHKEALDQLQMLDMREAAAAPEFSRETIKADWWTAVYLPIPENADPELLAHARDVAGWSRDGLQLTREPVGFSAYEPVVIGSEYDRAENIEHANARIAELNARLDRADGREQIDELDNGPDWQTVVEDWRIDEVQFTDPAEQKTVAERPARSASR